MIEKAKIEALINRMSEQGERQRLMIVWNGYVACQKAYMNDASARNLRDMKASEVELERLAREMDARYPLDMPNMDRKRNQRRLQMGELTDKQERFCQEYVIDLNATSAAKRAGYKAKGTNEFSSIGAQNLGKLRISQRIQELKTARAEKLKIEAEEVLRELWNLGTYSATEYFTWDAAGNVTLKASDKLTKEQAKRISAIKQTRGKDGGSTLEMKFYDKVRSLELVGQHIGLFREGGCPTSPDELLKMMTEYQAVIDATVPNPDDPAAVLPLSGVKTRRGPIVNATGGEMDDTVPRLKH